MSEASAVSMILANNYVTLATLTAIIYDYTLVFFDEIEYVWNKPWTWVSTLYILVRYCGLVGGIIYVLGNMWTRLAEWLIFLFIAATDLTMILRVWAIYARSHVILGILLALYVIEIIPFIISCVIVNIRLTATTQTFLNFHFCTDDNMTPAILVDMTGGAQFPLATTMCLLVTAKFVGESLEMYRATKQWQPGRYMKLFAREGILYFVAVFLFALCDLLHFVLSSSLTNGWQGLLTGVLEWLPILTLSPRCILSLRALYERDARGRSEESSHDNLDSGFGLTMVDGYSVGEMRFAPRNVEDEQREEMVMRVSGALHAGV